MIKNIKITNHIGESIDLELRSPEQSGFFVRRVDGLGPSNSNVNTTQGAGIDGSFYNSSRITDRNIVLDLGFYYWSSDSIETIRQRTYRYFPMKKPIVLAVEMDNRTGLITGYVESNEPNIFSKEEGTIISVVCPSPFFYKEQETETLFSGVTPSFEFPFENPSLVSSLIEFGSVFLDTQKNILYDGDVETGVMIYIDILDAVNNLTIFNITANQTMAILSSKIISLTGSDLIAGDKIVISSLSGQKYVHLIRSGVTYNLLTALGAGSKWLTLDSGDNLFSFIAASGSSKVLFRVIHRTLYGGL